MGNAGTDYAKTVLVTADGRKVTELDEAVVALMAANGKPPEVICWGSRFFVHDSEQPDALRYREVLCHFARVGDPPKRRLREVVQ